MINIPLVDADIVKHPADYKKPPSGELMLVPIPTGKCIHFGTTFEIDVKGGKCKCLGCNEEVSPMFVLERLMQKESQWMQTRASYQSEMQRLNERNRTKCQHCHKITRISSK